VRAKQPAPIRMASQHGYCKAAMDHRDGVSSGRKLRFHWPALDRDRKHVSDYFYPVESKFDHLCTGNNKEFVR